MTGRALTPLLFLDVDGPLLPFGGRSPSTSSANPLLGHLDLGLGPRLAALPVRLVWATSWGGEANATISPLLGWPDLPVVEWPHAGRHDAADDWLGLHWKTRPLLDWAAGRAFVWVDDELTEADRDWVRSEHPGSALLHRVDARIGLRESDCAVIGDWVRTVGRQPGS